VNFAVSAIGATFVDLAIALVSDIIERLKEEQNNA